MVQKSHISGEDSTGKRVNPLMLPKALAALMGQALHQVRSNLHSTI